MCSKIIFLFKEVLGNIGLTSSIIKKDCQPRQTCYGQTINKSRMPNTQILPSNIGHSSGTSLLSYPFNIAFYLFYLYLNSEPNEFDTYKITLDTIDPNTGLFSDSEIKSKFD